MPRHSVEAVIDRDEDRGLALAGQGRGQVGAPHLVDPLGADGAVVGPRAVRPADPARRQQTMLAHQPQDAALGGADAGEAQPCPDLAIALAVERAAASSSRIASTSAASGIGPTGPGRRLRTWLVALGDDDTAWPATCPRPGSPAGCRKAGWRRARPGGSSPRPPPCQRAAGLQVLDLGLEQLVGHGQIADLGLEAADLEVAAIGGPASSTTPRRRPGRRRARRSARPPSPRARATPAPDPPRAAAATPRSACAWPTSAGACSGAGPSPPACWARSAGPAPRAVVSVMLTSLRSFI